MKLYGSNSSSQLILIASQLGPMSKYKLEIWIGHGLHFLATRYSLSAQSTGGP